MCREHQVVVRRHRRLGGGDRLAVQGEEALDRLVEVGDARIATGLQRYAPAVGPGCGHRCSSVGRRFLKTGASDLSGTTAHAIHD